MALPRGLLDVSALKEDQTKITRISGNLEVRKKPSSVEADPDSTDEEIRWVVTCDAEATLEDVSSVGIGLGETTTFDIYGRIRGGAQVAAYLSSDDFSQGSWKITKDEVTGINDDGSLQAVHSQTWVGVSDWIDAEWNESGS